MAEGAVFMHVRTAMHEDADSIQLRFPFAEGTCVDRTVWLGTGTRRSFADLERLLARGCFGIDGVDAAPLIDDSDILLLRCARRDSFGVFCRNPSATIVSQLETWIAAAAAPDSNSAIREILMIGFGPGRPGRFVPNGATTTLERAFSALRHEGVRHDGAVILSLCERLKRRLPASAPPQLLALLERESGDARMRGQTGDVAGRSARRHYQNAAALFEAAGQRALSLAACRLGSRYTLFEEQLSLPGIEPWTARSPHWGLGYRVEKVLARGIKVRFERCDHDQASLDAGWQLAGHVDLPRLFVGRLLNAAAARTFKIATTVDQPENEAGWRVTAGVVPELSAMLNVAGCTESTRGQYTFRLHSETCAIYPRRAESSAGRPAEFRVCPSSKGPHRVEVELTSQTQQITVVNLEMPTTRCRTGCGPSMRAGSQVRASS